MIEQRPFRILQVSTAELRGGAAGSAWNLFREYGRRGHDSWMAVGRKQSDNPDVFVVPNEVDQNVWARFWHTVSDLVERYETSSVLAHHLGSTSRALARPRRALKIILGIEYFGFPGSYQLLDLPPYPPDILHCHNLHGGYFDLRALRWLSHQVPTIVNLRDAWLLSGHCAYSLDCERWRHGCGQCPYLETYPSIRRDATALNWRRKCQIYAGSRLYVTTPSQWLMDKTRASMLQGAMYRVIPNGIDTTVFNPGNQAAARRLLGLPSDAKIVLLTAHTDFKDFETMKRALEKVRCDDGSELLFVCLGKSGIERQVGSGRMIFVGFERDKDRLVAHYRAADAYIHAAKEEAFGKTITEAMACGTPVVATAVGGIPEQIEDGTNGLLVAPNDHKALAAAVQELLSEPTLRSKLSLAGINSVQERYTLQRQATEFLDWYDEVLQDWVERREVNGKLAS